MFLINAVKDKLPITEPLVSTKVCLRCFISIIHLIFKVALESQ